MAQLTTDNRRLTTAFPMWANNEMGMLFPVESIAEICRSRGVLYHCDAVQAAGKVEIDVRKIPADYLSLTGHKFHAPKRIGALYIRRKSPFSPLVYGGHQERNRRGGTESVPLTVGMGESCPTGPQTFAGLREVCSYPSSILFHHSVRGVGVGRAKPGPREY
jgi:cysteine sulfinate desulfinase/cysteine desulfurase-like protein